MLQLKQKVLNPSCLIKRHKPEISLRTLIVHCASVYGLLRFGKQRNLGTEKRTKIKVHRKKKGI